MSQITITGDNSPAGILRHWERKPKTECAREILRCWQKIDQLSADLDGLAHRDTDKARRIQELEKALKRQASAAKMGMDAAKSTGMAALDEAKRMRSESSPEALESERAANAQLTEENEALRDRVTELESELRSHKQALSGIQVERDALASMGAQSLRFPIALRKMWTGAEVQKWLDEQTINARQKSPDHLREVHESSLLDSQAYQLEKIWKAMLADDYELAKKLAQESMA